MARTSLTAVLAGVLGSAFLVGPPAAAAIPPDGTNYSHYQPYVVPPDARIAIAPEGYQPVYLESFGRHGTRTSVDDRSAEQVKALWRKADAQHAVTARGQRLYADTVTLEQKMAQVGYGHLTALGVDEWTGIGKRSRRLYDAFFTQAVDEHAPIRFVTSSYSRTQESADAFESGLQSVPPDLTVTAHQVNDKLTKFDTPTTSAGRKATQQVSGSSATKRAAASILTQLYGGSFAARVKDQIGEARAVWAVYAAAPSVGMDFTSYLLRSDSNQLGLVKDAEDYYQYGAGVVGNHAYASANVVRTDFFARIDDKLAGRTQDMATFRFGHQETLMPFLRLIAAAGYAGKTPVSQPLQKNSPYWRSNRSIQMGTNVDWAVYRNGSSVLVGIRVNEEPTVLRGSCRPSTLDGSFYELAELKRCIPTS